MMWIAQMGPIGRVEIFGTEHEAKQWVEQEMEEHIKALRDSMQNGSLSFWYSWEDWGYDIKISYYLKMKWERFDNDDYLVDQGGWDGRVWLYTRASELKQAS